MVVDAVIRNLLRVTVGEEAEPEAFGIAVQQLAALFYV